MEGDMRCDMSDILFPCLLPKKQGVWHVSTSAFLMSICRSRAPFGVKRLWPCWLRLNLWRIQINTTKNCLWYLWEQKSNLKSLTVLIRCWSCLSMAIGQPTVGWFPGLEDPTGESIWPPAVVLMAHLSTSRLKALLHDKSVLELGAGNGHLETKTVFHGKGRRLKHLRGLWSKKKRLWD